jgi:hypothetical protein
MTQNAVLCLSCASALHWALLQDVVLGLSSLTSLQDLCLGDPFWGDCPVTSLSNYQTFMLAQLPQLSSLDTLVLAAETKAAATATFAKKKLYYNMRRRTMRRGLEDLCRQAKAAQQVRRLVVQAQQGRGSCSCMHMSTEAAEAKAEFTLCWHHNSLALWPSRRS